MNIKYKVVYSEKAKKQLKKLDKFVLRRILSWIDRNLDGRENPYFKGKGLEGPLKNLWRYIVGNYRILAKIDNDRIIILIVSIAHRKDVYNLDFS
jgi:mRNA interferase RelE/StbE